ncbi:MAG TPA: DUF2782 domain-containing protein [Burkholderiales bacterium]|nr:DUF2782 domain-containing protein [Burkholderiales bacterium]
MRPLAVFVLTCAVASSAAAQPNPQTMQELPPPEISGPDEPAVQIPVQKEDRVEEVREGGRVVMLKVTPPGGRSYYLVDTTGNGNWMRRDPLDDGVRVPMWPIYIFE